MYRTILPLVICLLCNALSAQEAHNLKDFQRMENAAKIRSGDTAEVRNLLRLYDKFYVVRTDSMAKGMNLVFRAYQLALKLNDHEGAAEASLRVADNLRFFKNQKKAIDYYFLSLKYFDLSKLVHRKSKAYTSIGLIFYEQKKWDQALHYFDRAILINQRTPVPIKKSTPVYLSGLCYNEKKDYPRAIVLLNQSISIAVLENDSTRMHECYLGIAKARSELNEFDKALELYEKTAEYYSDTRHPTPLAQVQIHKEIASILLRQRQALKALEEAKIAYAGDKKLTISYYSVEITELLSRIYFELKNPEMAYYWLKENQKARDSATNRDILAEISVSEAKYEFEKKENMFHQQIEADKRKRNLAIVFMLIFATFILFGIYFYLTLRRERRKSENLLLNILPAETAEELKKYGHVVPKKHAQITIMFCDVKEFTKISESLSPETLVNMLDEYISGFDEIISDFGLEKIKTIGDAYMCAAGLHNTQGNPALHAVIAAMKLLDFVQDVKHEMVVKYGQYFEFRIGMHTGPLVSGVVGSKKYAYDIWGDTVNTAARMEEQSEPGKINISAATKNLVESEILTHYRGKIRAKNKDEMEMYFVSSRHRSDPAAR